MDKDEFMRRFAEHMVKCVTEFHNGEVDECLATDTRNYAYSVADAYYEDWEEYFSSPEDAADEDLSLWTEDEG